jgi:hypothetical protein
MSTHHTTEAVVHALSTGANGIPDLPVESDAVKQPLEDEDSVGSDRTPSRQFVAPPQTSWVGLIALGAVVVGALGACVGLMRSRRRRRQPSPLSAVPDPHALTPPHGDKLLRRH